MRRRKMSFPEYHTLEKALILIERVMEYRGNMLSDYSFTDSAIDQLIVMECEHKLESLYEIKNKLLGMLPERRAVNIEKFKENCEERRKLWEERKNKKL